ncbi:MAG: hypothetical protein P8Y14_16580 [Anaerolineales bacterium]
MRVPRPFLLLPISLILSYGLVIIANHFQLFSYTRFGILALYLTPAVFLAILLLSHRFPLSDAWRRSRDFRREALWLAGLALIASLALTPVYEGVIRYLATLAIVSSALLIWGTILALPAISGETQRAEQSQAAQATAVKPEPYPWEKNYIEKILLAFFVLVGAIGTGIFLYMAPFVRMYGDDWCYHTQALVRGIFAASIYHYLTWSGRFSSNFLLFAGAGSRWTPLIQMMLVVASIFTLSYLALSASAFGGRQAGLSRPLRILWSLACAFFIPFITFSITPDPYKSLYWIVSSVAVLPFMILIPAYLALAKPLLAGSRSEELSPVSRGRAAGYAVFAFALGFMVSTIHEVATLPVMILSGVLFSLALFSKGRRPAGADRYRTIILAAALGGSLLGFVITFFSPGNAIRHARQGYLGPPDVLTLLRLNTGYFLNYLIRISHWRARLVAYSSVGATVGLSSLRLGPLPISSAGIRFSPVGATVVLSPLRVGTLAISSGEIRFSKDILWDLRGSGWFALIAAYTLGYLGARPGRRWWIPLVVLALTLVMTWASFLPGAYAAQLEIPLRAELIPTSILVLGSFTAGFLSPKSYPGYLPVAVLSIVLLLNAFYMKDMINTQLALVKPIVNYASQWDLRDARLMTSDEPVYLLNPPWDEVEQGANCVLTYYNFRRYGINEDYR